jgi:hypothetical protein
VYLALSLVADGDPIVENVVKEQESLLLEQHVPKRSLVDLFDGDEVYMQYVEAPPVPVDESVQQPFEAPHVEVELLELGVELKELLD